ncbi:hypothetical protein MPTK1_2g15650 [Marchantia polymorpha subsp. ruderalis]|uniref:Uncharacterized protein n=1 Tax=Marchantia polymorpha TaxID=3197 RepID=A0A2R6WK33_MARPO|nr:hypothetical protein MARPO_0082s0062 [Marchantia polymorpha]BBN02476.1 hypothetical protein Mp_2g15650 [Marchantia polymorpha subsp. ruderalis]|eukprot:PTQ34227.1 hypothetical protein MARPO_0082s0062 [Marchantia polymorpha]
MSKKACRLNDDRKYDHLSDKLAFPSFDTKNYRLVIAAMYYRWPFRHHCQNYSLVSTHECQLSRKSIELSFEAPVYENMKFEW